MDARLLEILSKAADGNPLLKNLPNSPSTPELNIKMAEGEPFTLIDKLKAEGKFEGAEEIITIDGVRVEYADGFGLARPSNTTPVVVLRFEADSAAALARIQGEFKRALQSVWPGLAAGAHSGRFSTRPGRGLAGHQTAVLRKFSERTNR